MGHPDCLTGKTFVITGVLDSLNEAGEFHVDEAWATAAKPLWLFPS